MALAFRSVFILFLLLTIQTSWAQMRNPYNEEILPFSKDLKLIQEPGNFNQHKAMYGFVNHTKGKYALPFLTFCPDTSNSWLVILNGGPGRSNIRFSFDIDSLLQHFNILLPGYRGVDDRALENVTDEDAATIHDFIQNNQTKYATEKIAADIGFITDELQLSALTIVAHSYGTLVASELYKAKPQSIDTILAFSPVDPCKPMPDPEKIRYFVFSMLDSVQQKIEPLEDTLAAWLASELSDELAMGFVASMYSKTDFKNLLEGMLNGDTSRSDVIEKNDKYLKKRNLIDFALKINRIEEPESIKKSVYSQITHIFYEKIQQYLEVENKNLKVSTISADLPANFFIPKYEFFYTHSYTSQHTQNCTCGHADLWERAPKFILGKKVD